MTIESHRLAGYSENREKNDFYPTPAWATEALFKVETFHGNILEPAAGNGDMVRVIEKYNTCISKELMLGQNFLDETLVYDNVVTNPPFKLAAEFVVKSKAVARYKIALFLKLVFLEGVSRQELLKSSVFPLARIYVFSRRVSLYAGGLKGNRASGTMAFAWFIWDISHNGPATIHWL